MAGPPRWRARGPAAVHLALVRPRASWPPRAASLRPEAPPRRGARARLKLEVIGATKVFGGKHALEDVSVHVKQGEVVGVLGANGSGKSTLFGVATGRMPPDTGRVVIGDGEGEGRDVTDVPLHARAHMGVLYVPQEASAFRDWTVAENVAAAFELAGAADVGRATSRVLDDYGLAHAANTPARSVSGGERRRLEVARVLARFADAHPPPRFLVVDEPFAGVDPRGVRSLQATFARLASRQLLGVLLTDHNVAGVLGAVDRAYVLHQGRVVAHGSPETLRASRSANQAYPLGM